MLRGRDSLAACWRWRAAPPPRVPSAHVHVAVGVVARGITVQRAIEPLANTARPAAQRRLAVPLAHECRTAAVARALGKRSLVPLARDAPQHAAPLPWGTPARVLCAGGERKRERAAT